MNLPANSAVGYSEVILMTAGNCGTFNSGIQVPVIMTKLFVSHNLTK